MADDNHEGGFADYIPTFLPAPVATQASVFQAFARKLNEFNDQQVRSGLVVPALQDPRDVLKHVLALAAGMHSTGEVPPMGLVDALGAQVIALGMSVARVEDGRLETGGDNAA